MLVVMKYLISGEDSATKLRNGPPVLLKDACHLNKSIIHILMNVAWHFDNDGRTQLSGLTVSGDVKGGRHVK